MNRQLLKDWLVFGFVMGVFLAIYMPATLMLNWTRDLKWYWLKLLSISLPMLCGGAVILLRPSATLQWYRRLNEALGNGAGSEISKWHLAAVVSIGALFLICGLGLTITVLGDIIPNPMCIQSFCDALQK